MPIMRLVLPIDFSRKSIKAHLARMALVASRSLAASATCALSFFSCQMPQVDGSDVNIAGGQVTSEFGGTYYAQVSTFVGGTPSGDISNVATLLDVGAPQHKVLVVSLADAYRTQGSQGPEGFLPVIDELSIKLHGDAGALGAPVLNLERLKFQRDGKLTGQIPVVFVGARLERVPGTFISRLVANQVEAVGSRVVDPSPLMAQNLDLRNVATSFVMIAIPNQYVGQLQAAKIITAENRPKEDELAKGQLTLVGYGDISQLGENRLVQVTRNTMRNSAPLKVLDSNIASPLRSLTKSSPNVAAQLWEVEGAGICGAKEQKNYDTGAAIYYRASASAEWSYVGFVSKTTSKLGGFLGIANCEQVSPEDMASLVVSPSQSHIAKISSQL